MTNNAFFVLNAQGLIAGSLQYFGFAPLVDDLLGPSSGPVAHGAMCASLIMQLTDLSHPGLIDHCSYLYLKPLPLFFGTTAPYTAFSDDQIAASLQRLVAVGPEQLYASLRAQIKDKLAGARVSEPRGIKALLKGPEWSQLLLEYLSQGFLWPQQRVDDCFLEREDYCHALCALLACGELIAAASQVVLRARLKEQGVVVPRPDGSPGATKLGPTWKRVCTFFEYNCIMLMCDDQGTLHITNFKQPYALIVAALGDQWWQMYDIEHIRTVMEGHLLIDEYED